MFDWLINDGDDAISMLRRDHDTVKDLFDRFEKAERQTEKRKVATQALRELRIHSALEEELFYPAIRAQLNNGVMNEADEEHHVAKLLIAELESMNGDNDRYNAKFTVLAESVRHHIKEEENQILPKAQDLQIDFQALARRMDRRKQELKSKGFPRTAEDAMIGAKPAKATQPKKRPASTTRKRLVLKRSSNSTRSS